MSEQNKIRSQLIRKGNQAFNEGKILLAGDIYKKCAYKDGLIRVGDYYYHEKHQPLMAYGYYRAAGHEPMLGKINDGFVFALKCWLWPDKPADQNQPESTDENPADQTESSPTRSQAARRSVGGPVKWQPADVNRPASKKTANKTTVQSTQEDDTIPGRLLKETIQPFQPRKAGAVDKLISNRAMIKNRENAKKLNPVEKSQEQNGAKKTKPSRGIIIKGPFRKD